jgi:hypothetical protein
MTKKKKKKIMKQLCLNQTDVEEQDREWKDQPYSLKAKEKWAILKFVCVCIIYFCMYILKVPHHPYTLECISMMSKIFVCLMHSPKFLEQCLTQIHDSIDICKISEWGSGM